MRNTMYRAVAAMLLLVVCVACGRKGPPMPPLIRIADPTRDLTAVQREWLAELRWSYPQTTTAGGALPDLEKIEILRADIPKSQEPPADTDRDRQARRSLFEARASVIAELEGESLALATDGAMLVFTEDVSAWFQVDDADRAVLWYAVRSQCCNKRLSELSNVVRLLPAEPLPPPTGLEVVPDKAGLQVKWTAAEDQKVIVERATADGEYEVVSPSPQTEDQFVDRTAMQGWTWSFRLRAVEARADGFVFRVGEASPPVHVDYPDLYPPAAPEELVCLPEGRRVRLRWRGSVDAALYVVERRRADGESRILADDVQSPHYLDERVPARGATYLVRAIDEAGNQSEAVLCEASPGGGP